MTLSSTIPAWRANAARFMTAGWWAFLISFLIMPESHLVNYVLWGGVLLPLILVVRVEDIAQYHRKLSVNLWWGLLIFLLLSFFWASFTPETSFSRYFKRLLYLYGFFLATYLSIRRDPRLVQQLFTWGAVTIAAAALLQMIVFYRSHDFPLTRLEGPGRLQNPIHFGVVAISLSIISVLRWQKLSHRWRALSTIALIINCSAVYLCQSRGALLAIICAALFCGFFNRRVLPAVLIVAVVVGSLSMLINPETLMERGLSLRPTIWSAQFERFEQCNALIGCGLGVDPGVTIDGRHYENSHSIYLGWLMYTGIVGLALYVMFLLRLLYLGIVQRHYELTILVLIGASSTLTAGDHVLVTPNPYWPVLWIPIALLLSQLAAVTQNDKPIWQAQDRLADDGTY